MNAYCKSTTRDEIINFSFFSRQFVPSLPSMSMHAFSNCICVSLAIHLAWLDCIARSLIFPPSSSLANTNKLKMEHFPLCPLLFLFCWPTFHCKIYLFKWLLLNFFSRSHSLPPSFECMCNVYACFWCSVFRFWFIVWAESNKQCLRKLVCVSVSVYVSSYFLFLFIRFVRLFKYGCGLWGGVFYAVGNNAYSNGSGNFLKTFAITDSFILSSAKHRCFGCRDKGREEKRVPEFDCSYACEEEFEIEKRRMARVCSAHWGKRMCKVQNDY